MFILRSFINTTFIAIALTVFAIGCAPEHKTPDITSKTPAEAATNVDVKTSIVATFNLAMNSTTINKDTFFVVRQGDTSHIDGTITYLAGVATFTPSSPLVRNTTYNVTVLGSVKNLNGDSLSSDRTWSFTTGSGGGAKFGIFTSAGGAFSSSAVYNKTDYLVGMQGNGSNKVFIQRVNTFGNITGFGSGTAGSAPVLAFDGTKSLIVWSDANKIIQGARIDSANAVTNLSPISTTVGIMDVGPQSLLCNTLECIVVWRDKNTGIGYSSAIASNPPTCQVNETPVTSASDTDKDINISIAANESTYFMVWDTGKDIFRRIVTKCGLQSYKTEFSIASKTLCANLKPSVGVAFDGTNYLVVWNEAVDCASSTSVIRGQLVDQNGSAVGTAFDINDRAVISHNWRSVSPSIAFDGTNYLVAWTDGRNDANKDGNCDSTEETCDDVWGQYLSKTGASVGSEFVINNDAGNQKGFVTGFNADSKSYLVTINSSGKVYGVFITP